MMVLVAAMFAGACLFLPYYAAFAVPEAHSFAVRIVAVSAAAGTVSAIAICLAERRGWMRTIAPGKKIPLWSRLGMAAFCGSLMLPWFQFPDISSFAPVLGRDFVKAAAISVFFVVLSAAAAVFACFFFTIRGRVFADDSVSAVRRFFKAAHLSLGVFVFAGALYYAARFAASPDLRIFSALLLFCGFLFGGVMAMIGCLRREK